MPTGAEPLLPPATTPPRTAGIFVVAAAALAALWLPGFESPLQPADLPAGIAHALDLEPSSRWRLRGDYFLIPLLFGWAAGATWRAWPGAAAMGLSLRNFGAACRALALPTLAALAAILALGALWGASPAEVFAPGARFWKRLIPIPAFFQQLVIQGYFHRQLMPWLGRGRRAAAALTLYFVLLHAPNPGLMLGTLVGMYFWARVFQRAPNLYALALSHALLSAALMGAFPKALLPSVSVGLRFVEKGLAAGWWP
ncbi:MAG: CPBP family intramembrane metalloprotease [Verrucomicrobiae bacterium]|nr:CPBP family intramembrane metalloprotease [Verrucomicrobiae bacterium]